MIKNFLVSYIPFNVISKYNKKFLGCLHQGDGLLVVFELPGPDHTYEIGVETIHAMSEVLDALYVRARNIR